VNIFRDPPNNPKGFFRFLGERYYVAAWYPILLIYIGSKTKYWSQIWHYGLKFIRLFVILSPLFIILFLTDMIWWPRLIDLIMILPLFLVNWDLMTKKQRYFSIITFILIIFFTFLGGSRGYTLRLLFYLPVIYWILLLNKQRNRTWRLMVLSIILFGIISGSIFVYNNKISNNFSGQFKEQISKFEGDNFSNSRKAYAYPDFFISMDTQKDWIFGRGLNGTFYSPVFESVMKDIDESNSLGLKKGYRPDIECGYLHTILKIGLLGLVLKLVLAISAIYLGFFKSKNWFVKGCAFIIFEWLIFMYPAGLPEWTMSYMLFWLCIGACLSKETRMISTSHLFISEIGYIRKINTSFFRIKRF
jgi:hypothetical protein